VVSCRLSVEDPSSLRKQGEQRKQPRISRMNADSARGKNPTPAKEGGMGTCAEVLRRECGVGHRPVVSDSDLCEELAVLKLRNRAHSAVSKPEIAPKRRIPL
jgi:hypothetical protein